MREICTSGSVRGWGERSPQPTRILIIYDYVSSVGARVLNEPRAFCICARLVPPINLMRVASDALRARPLASHFKIFF